MKEAEQRACSGAESGAIRLGAVQAGQRDYRGPLHDPAALPLAEAVRPQAAAFEAGAFHVGTPHDGEEHAGDSGQKRIQRWVDQSIEDAKSGELLGGWARLPALQRVRLTALLRELISACEKLELTPTEEFSPSGEPFPENASYPSDLKTSVGLLGALPEPDKVPPDSPAFSVAVEQQEVAAALNEQTKHILRSGGVNPRFT